MPRKLSPETELRTAKRVSNALRQEYNRTLIERNAAIRRATMAEQEVAEWKKRFDALLFQGYKEKA